MANNIALELTAATSVAFLRSLSTMMTPLLALAFYRRKFGKKNTFRFSCWSLWGSTCSAAWAGCPGLVWEKSFPPLRPSAGRGPDFWRARPDRVDPVTLTTLQTAASALMALLCALAFDQGIHLGAATPRFG